MMNSKPKFIVYMYLFLVFTIIFGLSFTVHGNKITGSIISQITENFITAPNFLSVNLVLFALLALLALSWLLIRYLHEVSGKIQPKKIRSYAVATTLIILILFFSFIFYFGFDGNDITGFVAHNGIAKKNSLFYEEDGLYIGTTDIQHPAEFVAVSEGKTIYSSNGKFYVTSSDKPLDAIEISLNDIPEQFRNDIYFYEEDEEITTSKNLPNKEVNKLAKFAVQTLLDQTLGSYAYDQVSEYCKDQYESSDYESESNEPVTVNAPPLSPLQKKNRNCLEEKTTLTAQGKERLVSTGFTYKTSWTVTACKEDTQYTVYLANGLEDRINIATGIAKKDEVKSEAKLFTYGKTYSEVCVQVSDDSIGENGYACFSVV
jgi:hypothetical protein